MDLKERLAQAKIDQAKIAASVRELEQQMENNKIPSWIELGMVFESPSSRNLFMVTRVNESAYLLTAVHLSGQGYGPNLVGNFAATFGETYFRETLRRKIVYRGMIYKGHFNDLFERKN